MVPAPSRVNLIFGREPVFWIAVLQALVSLVVAFGLSLSSDQAGAVIAVTTALLAVVQGWATRPIAPAIFSGLQQSVLALLLSFGLHLDVQQIGATMIVTHLLLSVVMVRPQVSPVVITP